MPKSLNDSKQAEKSVSLDHFGEIDDWPSEDAFLDMSNIVLVGNDEVVGCRKIAVCDQLGRACASFCIGETAFFYTEFEALEDVDVPISGIDIMNSMNLVLHSKGTMHHLLKAPPVFKKGQRIRFKQTMKLSVAPGAYAFVVAFATMKAQDYEQAQGMGSASLLSKIIPIFRINQAGVITVREKETGLRLPFHGFIDLEGSAACELLPD
jgi:hypothetical protein